MNSLDTQLFYAINGHGHSAALDHFMVLVSQFGTKGLGYAILLVVLLVAGKAVQRRAAIAGLVAAVLGVGLGDGLLKHAFHRLRPAAALPHGTVHVLMSYQGSSFPSGHATAAFAVAVAVGGRWRPALAPLLVLAVLMAVSRVYVGAHYPSDVLGGAVLGTLIGLAVLYAERWFRRGEADGTAPGPHAA